MANDAKRCLELGCTNDIASDDERCPDCDFSYCRQHLRNHDCDGLLLHPDIDLLDEWEL